MTGRCSRCSAVTDAADRFCGECGAPLSVASPGATAVAPSPRGAATPVESQSTGAAPRLASAPGTGHAHWWWLGAVGLRLVLTFIGLLPPAFVSLATAVIVVPLAAVALTLWKPVRWTHAGLYTLALGLADPWLIESTLVTGEMFIGSSVVIALLVGVIMALFARSRERARAGAGPR